ncbi:hypothetical protein NKG05_18920 [Oerskovia sp. M15]
MERQRGAWQYHLTGTSAPRPAFIELVTFCREQGIPTVFWNKEDPVHFEDFLESAALFDRVCTTDVNRVPDYVERLGHDRVSVLPFAAQPAIHNPVRSHGRGPSGTSRSAACTSRTSTPSVASRWTCSWAGRSTSRPAWSTGWRSSPAFRAGTRTTSSRSRWRPRRGVLGLRADADRVPRVQGVPQRELDRGLPEHVRPPGLRDHGLRHTRRDDPEPRDR